jgi:outer membrane protein assembly factor BamA
LAYTAVQQFLSAMRVAFFCDAGNVWDKTASIALNNFAIAIGTGLRYNTLFGAIRVDFGFKFYDPYPPATADKNLPLAVPSNYSGVWIFNRKPFNFSDVFNIEFALGEAF